MNQDIRLFEEFKQQKFHPKTVALLGNIIPIFVDDLQEKVLLYLNHGQQIYVKHARDVRHDVICHDS